LPTTDKRVSICILKRVGLNVTNIKLFFIFIIIVSFSLNIRKWEIIMINISERTKEKSLFWG
jgi:hypothetical protein